MAYKTWTFTASIGSTNTNENHVDYINEGSVVGSEDYILSGQSGTIDLVLHVNGTQNQTNWKACTTVEMVLMSAPAAYPRLSKYQQKRVVSEKITTRNTTDGGGSCTLTAENASVLHAGNNLYIGAVGYDSTGKIVRTTNMQYACTIEQGASVEELSDGTQASITALDALKEQVANKLDAADYTDATGEIPVVNAAGNLKVRPVEFAIDSNDNFVLRGTESQVIATIPKSQLEGVGMQDVESIKQDVAGIKKDLVEVGNAVFDTITINELVNTNPIVEGGKALYTSTYITIQDSSNSSVATLSNVSAGETLYISSTVSNTSKSWGFTFTDDRNKTIYHYFDETLSGLADKTNIEITVPEGSTKLYVSRLNVKGAPEVFRKKTVAHKIPKSNLVDVLHEKKLLVFGDSMAYGHTIPESVWTKLLAEKHGMILTNFAQNGTTITRKTTTTSGLTFLDTDSIYAKVMDNLNNPVDADYIIVFGGTNDIARNDQCPLGTIDDATSQTFYGALNAICQRLIQTYPSGNICFITPYIRNVGLANMEICKKYIKAIHDVCEKHGGIPVFDNSVDGGVDFSNSYQAKALTMQDSYHLNKAGHLRAMHKYEVFLQTI